MCRRRAAGTLQDMPTYSPIEEALEALSAGRMVVVIDEEERAGEGDLVLAAEHVTPDAINFMTRQAGGWIAVALSPERCDELELELLPQTDDAPRRQPFTVTIEAREGVTTGISVADQARTILTAVRGESDDIVTPGHVRPLRAVPGGVLERAARTEAAVDLARLAGCATAGVICEVLNEDGTTARVEDLVRYTSRHQLPMIRIADLIAYRRRTEALVDRVAETVLPTAHGDFTAVGYREREGGAEHLALVKGDVTDGEDVLVRVHRGCLTGDALGSSACDCGSRLQDALRRIEEAGRGVVLHLDQGPRRLSCSRGDHRDGPVGLPVDLRTYGIGAQVLVDLGLRSMRLLTSYPKRIHGLEGYGLSVTAQEPVGRHARLTRTAARVARPALGMDLTTEEEAA